MVWEPDSSSLFDGAAVVTDSDDDITRVGQIFGAGPAGGDTFHDTMTTIR
jgi:hypothetical protein